MKAAIYDIERVVRPGFDWREVEDNTLAKRFMALEYPILLPSTSGMPGNAMRMAKIGKR